MLNERIKNQEVMKKVVSAEVAASLVKDGMVIGVSGFSPSGYPKAVPLALAQRVKDTGEKMKLTLYTGASVGAEIDGAWSEVGIISKRMPYQTNSGLRNNINKGLTEYIDMNLSVMPQFVNYGFLPKVNIAIIEALGITEEGNIIPTTAVGNTATYVANADKIIIEVNENQPLSLEGIADIYTLENPPFRKPIPIIHTGDRIGTTYIPCKLEKIVAVVMTNMPDKTRPLKAIDETSKAISKNLIKFLENEVKEKRLPENLLPIQSGVGSVANAVLAGLCESNLKNLTCYTEVIQDSMLDLIRCGKAKMVSSTALCPSPAGMEAFRRDLDSLKDKIILRPQEISNNPEVIRRLGVIAINTALEVDIYGNVNSTHVMGTKMMNGIGGSGDFAENASLTIFTTESIAKKGNISTIVPIVSHVDHTEHNVMVIVTEQGTADLRGKSPKERALAIINNCAHPDYRPQLLEYLEKAQKCSGKHTPHVLCDALSWHIRFMETGTMKKKFIKFDFVNDKNNDKLIVS